MYIHQNVRPRIGLLSRFDARNVRMWSGTLSFMAQALEKHVGDICYLGPQDSLLRLAGSALNRITYATLHKRFDPVHNVPLSKRFAQIFSRRLKTENCDVLFAPGASAEIAWLDTNLPILYLSDLTWSNIVSYYPEFTSLLPISQRQGEIIEARAIAKATALVYPSKWAAQTAVSHYHADASRVHVVPFGANLFEAPEARTSPRETGPLCRLFWVGVSWERKGGEIALATLAELTRLGIEAELVVCGCVPPGGHDHSRVRVIPFLDKNDETQRGELFRLFTEADFLLLPTRGDAFGIVFCEASAFGLPSITCDTGGVGGAVIDGENGVLLPLSAAGPEYAKVISDLWHSPAEYRRMALASRAAYEDRLNWDKWGQAINKILRSIM